MGGAIGATLLLAVLLNLRLSSGASSGAGAEIAASATHPQSPPSTKGMSPVAGPQSRAVLNANQTHPSPAPATAPTRTSPSRSTPNARPADSAHSARTPLPVRANPALEPSTAESAGTQIPTRQSEVSATDSPPAGRVGIVRAGSNPSADADAGRPPETRAGGLESGGSTRATVDRPESWNQGSRWGIELESLRLSAAGRALDFRFRIADPELASRVGRNGGPMYILDAEGRRIAERNIPAIGDAFENRHLDQPDRTYSTWFANQGNTVHRGDFVTIVMGDFRVSGIQVQ